ncbi:MAG: cation:proton antiporter, partial [candidate division KSB1 bacterium]|nr:cation:proton antiporter [candidate division KSB1 bacterium]
MRFLNEHHILIFLLQLFTLLAWARILGEVFLKWKQPALTAEILVGVLFGPTVMGRIFPQFYHALFPNDPIQISMLETVAWLGVFLLLLETGLEIDFSIAWRQRGSALTIALTDTLIPMAFAFSFAMLLPSRFLLNPDLRLLFAAFMAVALGISAMPVAARALHDVNLLKAETGFLVMSALAVKDIIGWVLFGIILGLHASAQLVFRSVFLILTGAIGFAALALTFGRQFSVRVFDSLNKSRYPEPATSLTITVLLGLLFGMISQRMGIHALFGFFIAGVIVGEAKSLSEQTRGIISQMVHALFVPLFFVNIGLKVDFAENFDLPLSLAVFVIGVGTRYMGAWMGANLAHLPRLNRDLISILHTPGGLMEIVVGFLAFQAGLIGQQVFVAIVFAAVISSIILGPWLSFSLKRRAMISPADLLSPQSVIADLKASSLEKAVKELVAVLPIGDNSLGQKIIDGILAREKEFGTAVGDGLAIPHLRLDGLRDPLLAFGRSKDGIEWNAPDGVPVRSIFLLVTPAATADIH